MKNQCGECTLCCTVLGWTDNASHLDKYNERKHNEIIGEMVKMQIKHERLNAPNPKKM